jgi:hypothetical protein
MMIYKVEKTNVIMLLQRIYDLGLPRSLKFSFFNIHIWLRRVWRYQRGNQKPYIEKRTDNAKRKNDKSTNNYLQNTSQKSKDVLYETRY